MGARTAVVVGVGQARGLGAALARRFAGEGLRVIVAGRTSGRIDAIAQQIRDGGGDAEARPTDASLEAEVVQLFESVGDDLEVAIYNVGANAMQPLADTSAELFEGLWRQNAFGGFLVGREAVRRMLPRGRGTVLFTGATASLRARPPFSAFASAKAALRSVAQGLAREFGPQGIHVAHVVVDGVIHGDYAEKQFPDFVTARGEDGLLEPDAIADAYWALHRQPKCAWTFELDLRPFKEAF